MSVHRCKFVEYKPEPIHCLAFSRNESLLAVSRADGDIEIWNVEADWVLERCIRGGENVSVEALAWVEQRLFSAGLDGYVVEWDLTTLTPKQAIDTNGGAVWCLEANNAQTMLATGCEDGRVRLLDVANDCLLFERGFEKADGRILAVAWHEEDQVLVSGSANSVVNKWSVTSGRSTMHITIADFLKESTLVWAIAILSDFTIVTGDSLGNTQFWDGAFGTLQQTFKCHEADVLALAVNKSETTIFASGVDNKVAQFKLAKSDNGTTKWVYSSKLRVHTHDVRALAITKNDKKDILVSGGVDTQLVVYSASRFEVQGPRRIPPFPHAPLIHLARGSDMLLCNFSRHVELWQLGSARESDPSAVAHRSLPLSSNPAMIAQISLKGDGNIMCSSISSNGDWVAISDVDGTKLFSLSYTETIAGRRCKVKKSDLNSLSTVFSHRLVFSPTGDQLISAGSDGVIRVANTETGIIECSFEEHKSSGLITQLQASKSGQYIGSADVNNNVFIFNIANGKLHCALSSFDTKVSSLSFQPGTDMLIVALSCNRIHVFDTKNKRIADWTRENVMNFPHSYLKKNPKTIGIVFDPTRDMCVFPYDHGMIARLDLSKPLSETVLSMDSGRRGRKTSESNSSSASSKVQSLCQQLYTTDSYKPLLFADFLTSGDLVVVERPWLAIMSEFPSQLNRNKYGS
eukprot:CFRG4669T1